MSNYKKLGIHGFSCACCGDVIRPDDDVMVCPDCGAVFCRTCVEAGELDTHACEPDDEEFD